MTPNLNYADNECEPETIVSVLLDGEEAMVEFLEDPKIDNYDDLQYDAFMVVFSLIEPSSFETATSLIRHLRVTMGLDRTIMLVANKTDLARQRRVNSNEARTIAMKYDCVFLETAGAINHYVDELLVGTLKQIRMKLSPPSCGLLGTSDDINLNKQSSPKRALNFLCKLFKRTNGRKAQSCDNLLVF
ncbi:hypothetical protein LOTGIDRAFT_159043 [Lottia gigantea]|uniref:Small monomeric GTPase n=1 Tax=Lottia gigantea TaxID=225164 RepID=V4A312_LOTGI|nr:hypothetical protein LOTGIDRAFT_159043 [Lottia gigantea]ESO98248.1 hypothetical protein LOTGIDRAFT_159043 [Lottia gigantea]